MDDCRTYVVGDTNCALLLLDPTKGFTLTEKKPCQFDHWYHSLANLDSRYFVVTGSGNEDYGAKCERYDTVQNEWLTLPNLKHPRYFHASCSHNNKVYVVGGKDAETDKLIEGGAIEVLDLNLDQKDWQWQVVKTDKLLERFYLGLTCFQGQLVIFGGEDDEDVRQDVVVFNPDHGNLNQLNIQLPDEFYTTTNLTIIDEKDNQFISYNNYYNCLIAFDLHQKMVELAHTQNGELQVCK